MARPALSVLIDTYNHERYIKQAIVSAIEQDFPASDYEIVVVDDGSTDRTPEIVREFAPRVRLLQKKNGGQASAFNAAFPELRGEIIALLDGDDWFAPGKLSAVMKAFQEHPEAAAVGHGCIELLEQTGEQKICASAAAQFLTLQDAESARRATSGWGYLRIGALTVRRRVLQEALPISEALTFCADGPIAWTAMALGTLVLPQPLLYYRHHATNLHAIGSANRERARRREEMNEIMFQEIERTLVRLGVKQDAMRVSLYPHWVWVSRYRLHEFGGSRLETLRTEMRSFRAEYSNPSFSYRLFRYLTIAAALTLSPRSFYDLWNWYGRRNIARFPQPLRRGG